MSQPLPRRRRPGRPRRAVLALVPVIGMGTLSACAAGAAPAPQGDPVKVALDAASGARTVRAGDRLRVTAQGGVLTEVRVTDPRGRQLPGGLARGGRSWTSRAKAAPGTKYSIVARTENAQGGVGATKESLTTAQAARLNTMTLDPRSPVTAAGAGRSLGIVFDFPVTDRAAVERRLSISTEDGPAGSWDWGEGPGGGDRVDWRPARPWKPGTEVTLRADLDGVDSGGGRYFAGDYDLNVTVGRSCPDSDMGRDCGKVHVGDPPEVTAPSERGEDNRAIGIGDWNVG
ncbi:Ig-like domain-containing protein [Streptomyces angustmyceticus]|uniref:Ig-like domain-containing protein n=1 Tax=Streptomyces angustmyceticus TaxID=285578 RepID=UPI0037F9816F